MNLRRVRFPRVPAKAVPFLLALLVFALTAWGLDQLVPPLPRWVQEVPPGHDKPVTIHFLHDGRLVGLAPAGQIFDVKTGRGVAELTWPENAENPLWLASSAALFVCHQRTIHPNGTWSDAAELVWCDLASGRREVLCRWPGPVDPASAQSTPDGRTVAVSAYVHPTSHLVVLDAAAGWVLRQSEFPLCFSHGFSPDGNSLALAAWGKDRGAGCAVRRLDVVTGKARWEIPTRSREPYLQMAFTPDGRTLVVADPGDADDAGEDPPALRLWDVATGAPRSTQVALPEPSPVGLYHALLQPSADGQALLLSGRMFFEPLVCDLATLRARFTVPGDWTEARFSPDGQFLAVWDDRGEQHIQVHAVENGRVLARLSGESLDGFGGACFIPSRPLLAVAHNAAQVRPWWGPVARWLPAAARDWQREGRSLCLLDPRTGDYRGWIPLTGVAALAGGTYAVAPDGQAILLYKEIGDHRVLECWDVLPRRWWGAILLGAASAAVLALLLGHAAHRIIFWLRGILGK
jgi:hypothetical protein